MTHRDYAVSIVEQYHKLFKRDYSPANYQLVKDCAKIHLQGMINNRVQPIEYYELAKDEIGVL